MKSAGTEHSKNKYTLKRNIDTFNQFVCSTFILFKKIIHCITFNRYKEYYVQLLLLFPNVITCI